jgi:hypothetical protein
MEIDSLYTINLSLLFLLRHFTPEKWMTEKWKLNLSGA